MVWWLVGESLIGWIVGMFSMYKWYRWQEKWYTLRQEYVRVINERNDARRIASRQSNLYAIGWKAALRNPEAVARAYSSLKPWIKE